MKKQYYYFLVLKNLKLMTKAKKRYINITKNMAKWESC